MPVRSDLLADVGAMAARLERALGRALERGEADLRGSPARSVIRNGCWKARRSWTTGASGYAGPGARGGRAGAVAGDVGCSV